MDKARAFARLLWVLAKHSSVRAMQYPMTFWSIFFGSVGELLVQVLFFSLIYLAGATSIGGWSVAEVILLQAMTGIVASIELFLFGANIGQIPRLIRTGRLDKALLLPINTQLLLSCYTLSPEWLISGLVNVPLLVWAVRQLEIKMTLGLWLHTSLLVFVGVTVSYALSFIPATLAFWKENIFSVQALVSEVVNFRNYPISIFPAKYHWLIMHVFPIALISNFPTLAITSQLTAYQSGVAVVTALALLALTRIIFHKGLARYTSPGG